MLFLLLLYMGGVGWGGGRTIEFEVDVPESSGRLQAALDIASVAAVVAEDDVLVVGGWVGG